MIINFSLTVLFTIIFVILKLGGGIACSWSWVLFPLWFPTIISIIIMIVFDFI